MESNGKLQKGIMKAKLAMSFYRAAMPSSPMPYTTSKPKQNNSLTSSANSNNSNKSPAIQVRDTIIPDLPKQNIAPCTASSVGYTINQDQINPQPKQTVSFVIPPDSGARDSYRVNFDNPIDVRAASYISCVQERFKLERLNSECNV